MTLLEEIERDLQAFADPGTSVLVDASSATWEQDGKEISVAFSAGEPQGFPNVSVDGAQLSYRAFLASPWMANLQQFAEFIQKTDHRGPGFINTNATLLNDEGEAGEEGAATELVLRLSTIALPFLSTRVVLVQGEAGSGKTIVLRELASRQAERFACNEAKSVFFYVDAQGRALSRLEDAMAKDLQDLRSKFSYAAVAPLTRHNLIIPIIDGFDELLGSGGYDEAFSSLAAFLSTLGGRGCVVASARSAFFDYANFYDNARRFAGDGRLNYEVEAVDIKRWNDDQVSRYFRAYGARVANDGDRMVAGLNELRRDLAPGNRDLLSKPFYASRVARLVDDHVTVRSDEDLLDQLVEAFLDREHKKLLDKEGQPLLSKKGHRAFLTSLAEEMWWQESRRIDVGTVQVVAELVTESYGLPPAAARQIVEKVSSYAFLATDAAAKRFLRFEHEVFYSYFLAQKLREFVEQEPTDLRRFLARSLLDDNLAEQTVRLIGTDVERCTRAVEAICSVIRPTITDAIARENAGLLIATLLRAAGTLREGTTFRNVVFRQVNFGKVTLKRPRFEDCDFADVDLTSAKLIEPEFVQTSLRNVEVDLSQTKLAGASPEILDDVYGVRVRGRPGRVYSPDEVADIFRSLGAKIAKPTAQRARSSRVERRIEIVDRFVRKMERRFYASEDDIERFPFTNDHEWKTVKEALRRNGLLEEHVLDKSGPRQPLIRLAVPPHVLRRGENIGDRSLPDEVRAFWKDLLQE